MGGVAEQRRIDPFTCRLEQRLKMRERGEGEGGGGGAMKKESEDGGQRRTIGGERRQYMNAHCRAADLIREQGCFFQEYARKLQHKCFGT